VRCDGVSGVTCKITLAFTVVETLKHGKVVAVTARAKKKVVVLGSVTVVLHAGKSSVVRITLNAAAKRLLAQHPTLKVLLTLTEAGRHGVLSARPITFKAMPKK
jgi:hypothetical protein